MNAPLDKRALFEKNRCMSFDAIAIGDAMVDIFLSIQAASLHCRLNEKDCELCITYGDKIPVERSYLLLGGIACNVAVGLSRLGIRSALVAEIGDDELSQRIIRSLSEEGVDTSMVKQTLGADSSFSVGINFRGERTLFVGHVVRKHDFTFDNLEAPWVFLGGLGKEWESAYQRTVGFVKKSRAKLVFTPGSQQFEEGVERFVDVVNASYVLFVNLDEARRILGSSDAVSTLLTDLQKQGPRVVSITDGENGSYAIDERGAMYHLTTFPCNIVEKTGAGDAYTSGFLAALFYKQPVERAMVWGAANAASVIEKVGAQEGLLDRETVEVHLKRYPEIIARAIEV